MNKCDIIIPIYNAYDCVIECIDSVIKNTTFDGNILYLIDDKSPDDRILPLLKKYQKKYKFIKVIENEENLGFVGSVNKGMKVSKHDVVLLNSDTEVTPHWLEKIIKCAYSEKMIATVTPLSNNATLVSMPNGLQANELPLDMTLNEYSNLVELSAYNKNFQLPTAHGFCMFIKREVLDLVGYFDEETFGKGYGEENDFSFRCLDYGYKNILCDNTIIYHKEKQSFSEKRDELIKQNLKKLHERYPIYSRRIELWCENFPIKMICENIDYQIELHNRKNILILIHDWTDVNNNVGGTTLHVLDLINSMRSDYNFHILAPANGIYMLTSYFKDKEKVTKFPAVENCNLFGYYNSEYKKMIEDIIIGFRIDFIHIHHMIGHFFDVIDVAEQYKVKRMISLHDFYCLCPTINMLYKMEKYCPRLEEKNCKECLVYKTGLKNDVIPLWHRQWNEFLKKFAKIVVPSVSTKEEINRVYNDIDIEVIEHGINIEKTDYLSSIDDKDTYNVAFVGVMSVHKGGKVLLELLKKSTDKKIVFHLFGTTEFEELEHNSKNYIYHGKYKREELPKLLAENNINLVCSFSIWAETYSYTLTEEIASGVPVLSFDVGAVAQRLKDSKCGYIIKLDSNTDEILKKIEDIFNDRNEYQKIIKNIKNYKIKNVKEMADDYREIYNITDKININENNANYLKTIIRENYQVKESVNNAETAWILNSLKWKIVSKIKVPNVVKKVVKKVMR